VPIFELFSHRNRPRPEELAYDQLPKTLRAALHRVLREALGGPNADHTADSVLNREHPTRI
jgi:hypothetical protein